MFNRRVQVGPKTKAWINILKWGAAAILLVAAGFQFIFLPYLENTRIRTIANQLSDQYGLVVSYGDPAEFFIPPLEPVDKAPHIRVERAQIKNVAVALAGISKALEKYPDTLIRKYLKAVFVAQTLEISGVSGAAMYANQWIYVATPSRDGQAEHSYALSLHHELSSLLFYGGNFPTLRWHLVNDTDFSYLENYTDIINAASPRNRKDSEERQSWYQAGFVSDYGMASMENDVNTYAELAMGEPNKLRQLCGQYPRIRQKKKILLNFYTKLAPELGNYFQTQQLISEQQPDHSNVAAQTESKKAK